MKVISWNVRGLNKSSKNRMLKGKFFRTIPISSFFNKLVVTLKLLILFSPESGKEVKVFPSMPKDPHGVFSSLGTSACLSQ